MIRKGCRNLVMLPLLTILAGACESAYDKAWMECEDGAIDPLQGEEVAITPELTAQRQAYIKKCMAEKGFEHPQ
ncbi:MAG: hypothetical protein AAF637_23085 [Pseudomonadota bacterium]